MRLSVVRLWCVLLATLCFTLCTLTWVNQWGGGGASTTGSTSGPVTVGDALDPRLWVRYIAKNGVEDVANHPDGPLNGVTTGTVAPDGALALTTAQTLVFPVGSIPTSFTALALIKYQPGGQMAHVLEGRREDAGALTWFVQDVDGVLAADLNGNTLGGTDENLNTVYRVVACKNEPDSRTYPARNFGTTFTFEHVGDTATQGIAFATSTENNVMGIMGNNYGGGQGFLSIFRQANDTWTEYTQVTNAPGFYGVNGDGSVFPYRASNNNRFTHELQWDEGEQTYAAVTTNEWLPANTSYIRYLTRALVSQDGTLILWGNSFFSASPNQACILLMDRFGATYTPASTTGPFDSNGSVVVAGAGCALFLDRAHKLRCGLVTETRVLYYYTRPDATSTTWTAHSTEIPDLTAIPLDWLNLPVTSNADATVFAFTNGVVAEPATFAIYIKSFDYDTGLFTDVAFFDLSAFDIFWNLQVNLSDAGDRVVFGLCPVNSSNRTVMHTYVAEAASNWTLRFVQATIPDGGTTITGGSAFAGNGSRLFVGAKRQSDGHTYVFVDDGSATTVARCFQNGVAADSDDTGLLLPGSGSTLDYQLTQNAADTASDPSDLALLQLRVYDYWLTDQQIADVSTAMLDDTIRPYDITYGLEVLTFHVGEEIAFPCVYSGSDMASMACPALAVLGVTWSVPSGTLRGVPPSAAARATYTIVYTNAAGSTNLEQEVVILDTTVVVPTVSYGSSGTVVLVPGELVYLVPTLTPNDSALFSDWVAITPLPEGLALNAETGVITGLVTQPLTRPLKTLLRVTVANYGYFTLVVVFSFSPTPVPGAASTAAPLVASLLWGAAGALSVLNTLTT